MDIHEGSAVSADGSTITTYTSGPKGAPVMVLSNGLGGNIITWRHLIDHFTPAYRIVSWDYRGLYRSPPALEDSDEAYSVARHCEDLQAVLKAEKVKKAVFIGWSMGVQVNLEYHRRHWRRFLASIQINGTYGKPFETAFNAPWMSVVGPRLLDVMEKVEPLMRSVGPIVTRTRAFIAMAKAVGLASPTLDEDVFFDLARDYVNLDFTAYTRIFRALADHDARDMPAKMKCPTLVITGDRDLFTPIAMTRSMVDETPDVEFMAIKGGTHYTPLEYPMVVNLRIEKFLRERLSKAQNHAS
ncbi:MAG: alpha/beta hydrolase [Deltaproteobacteria bacterium]|nr:alpha/beta hydrolase [Deltaproteobacteria bacterium]